MLLEIRNLPLNLNYNDIKDFLRSMCGMKNVILDNLEMDGPGSKKVSVGLANESDAAVLVKKVHGVFLDDHQIFIENFKQTVVAKQSHNLPVSHNFHNNFPILNNMASVKAQTIAPGLVQLQSFDNIAYQNKMPFYQQKSHASASVSDFQIEVSDIQGRSFTEVRKITYPVKANPYFNVETNKDELSEGWNQDNWRSSDITKHGDGLYNRMDDFDHYANRDSSGASDDGQYYGRHGSGDHNVNPFRVGNGYRDRCRRYNGSGDDNVNRFHDGSGDHDGSRDYDGNVDGHCSFLNYHESTFCNNDKRKRNHASIPKWEPVINRQSGLKSHNQNIIEKSVSNYSSKKHQFDAFHTKKAKVSPMTLDRRIARHTTWVKQMSTDIAKEVCLSVTNLRDIKDYKLNSENKDIFSELKKFFENRINMIFGNKLAYNYYEVANKYKNRYNDDNNDEIYETMRAKVNAKGNDEKPSDTKDIESKSSIAPNNESIAQSIELQVPQNETKSSESNATSEKDSGDQTIPKYTVGEQKEVELPNLHTSILDKHITDIHMSAAEDCKKVDESEGTDYSSTWRNSLKDITEMLNIHTSNRIQNITSHLFVKVYCYPETPDRDVFKSFVKKYNIIGLKKLNKNLFIVRCGTYQGFDNLCKLIKTKIDGKFVVFKPIFYTGKQNSQPINAESDIEHSHSETEYNIKKDISELRQNILNDSDVIIIDDQNEIIDVDELEVDNNKIESYDKKLNIVETKETYPKNSENPSEFLDNISTSDNVQNDIVKIENFDKSGECIIVSTEPLDNQNNDNADSLLEPTSVKHESPNKVLGDNSYVVLDIACSDDKSQNIRDAITVDINEDDLEDY